MMNLMGLETTPPVDFDKEILIIVPRVSRGIEEVRLYKFTDFFYDSK